MKIYERALELKKRNGLTYNINEMKKALALQYFQVQRWDVAEIILRRLLPAFEQKNEAMDSKTQLAENLGASSEVLWTLACKRLLEILGTRS